MNKLNVLMICADHWPAALLRCAGHPAIETPTLDFLASGGIRYSNCYSECPACVPARRSLMTGTSPKTHGDRIMDQKMIMPDVPTLAESFVSAGYQAYGVGKLHVYPQRNRIGFNDVVLAEEGRYQHGLIDDYQIWLGENGYLGKEFLHGMGSNEYYTRPWHLSEEAHPTNWATAQMIKTIRRKDPTKPAFYYVGYQFPHPPLVPLQLYLDRYNLEEIDSPYEGDWVDDDVFAIKALRDKASAYTKKELQMARRAFYAQCTHIDQQIRLLIGALNEEKLLNDTIIVFTSDHGDMLGNHGLLRKSLFYENSCNVPLIMSGKPLEEYMGTVDDRLVCMGDIMPTLLDLCDITIPKTVEGISTFSDNKRDMLYCEISENDYATRMVTDGRFKLIYYPVGNYVQLFDLKNDPNELNNLNSDNRHQSELNKLTQYLISNLYNGDESWALDGKLIGLSNKEYKRIPNYSLQSQRSGHWPLIQNK